MVVRVGDEKSTPYHLKGGSPQGSIMGSYLYCATTQQLGPSNYRNQEVNRTLISPPPSPTHDDVGPPLSEEMESSPERQVGEEPPYVSSTPTARGQFARLGSLSSDEDDDPAVLRNFQPWNRINDSDLTLLTESIDLEMTGDIRPDNTITMVKYIDDSNLIEPLQLAKGKVHLTTNRRRIEIPAEGTGNMLEAIVQRAVEIGMLVNEEKTKSLCMSAVNHTEVSSRLYLGGEIASSETLKMLGFVFGRTPSVKEHIEHLQKKFRACFWGLIKLKKSGISGAELFKMYRVYAQPVIEFCNVVYHPMLNRDLENTLENMQKKAFRLAHGNESYSKAVEEGAIQTLRDRREKASDHFVAKALRNPKFQEWFPRRSVNERNLRNNRPIEERRSRTERHYRGPITSYRRRANNLIEKGLLHEA